jgi:type II secretory pathway pseudopilin PulG
MGIQRLEPDADSRFVKTVLRLLGRLCGEDGFGLIELAFAIVMLNIGILAIVAAFSGAGLALSRASKLESATAVADKQMESYRARKNCAIYLTASSVTTAQSDSTYTSDAAYSSPEFTDSSAAPSPIPTTCTTGVPSTLTTASQTIQGPDGRNFRVDTYINVIVVGGSTKQVTIVVRESASPYTTHIRETSTFDPALG